MTTVTDLSPERLDELEQDWRMWVKYDDSTAGLLGALGKRAPDVLTLIAMARAKQAAERRVSRLEKHLSLECSEFEEAYQAALAGRDEGYAMAQAAERERDALRKALEGTISMLYARDSFGDTYCRCCKETAGRPHSRTCATGNAEAALAQPTTEGGE